jgi:hypothetical protein
MISYRLTLRTGEVVLISLPAWRFSLLMADENPGWSTFIRRATIKGGVR